MSSLGFWQCWSGFSPGTERDSSQGARAGELAKRVERAEMEVARRVLVARERSFIVDGVFGRCLMFVWRCGWRVGKVLPALLHLQHGARHAPIVTR